MTRLSTSAITGAMTDRQAAEFLAHSLTLLAFPLRQDEDTLNASGLRLNQPELPRDPDLPILLPKTYPRLSGALIESANRSLVPPSPVEDFIGRKAELDQAVLSLLGDRPVVITGGVGSGKTALLRQLAHDSRIRKHFRRIWWLDDLDQAELVIGIALNAPNVLLADLAQRPHLIADYVTELGILLLIDNATNIEQALALGSTVVVIGEYGASGLNVTHISLSGLAGNAGSDLLAHLSRQAHTITRPLAALMDNHPLALRIVAALLSEDGLPPETITDFLRGVSGDRLSALYAASYEALPEAYQALCQAFAASPRRWMAVTTVLKRYDKPLVGQRALTFIERRGFVERRGDMVRTSGNWVDTLTPGESGFEPVARITDNFSLHSEDDEPAIRSQELHTRGIALIDEGRGDEAADVLNQALTLRQTNEMKHATAETLTALARVAYLRNDDASAIRYLETAAEHLHTLRDEDSLETVRLALSRAYRRAGRLDAALSVLSDDAPPQALVAVYRAREEWTEAITACQRWLEQADDPAAARFALAETYLFARQYAEALQTIAEDDTFGADWLRALTYHLQGDVEKALMLYRRIHPDAPSEWRGTLARAMARAMAVVGEVQEAAMLVGAEGVWYEAKMLYPAFARQRYSQALFAHLSLMLGKPDEAQAAAQRVFTLSGERPDPDAEAIAYRVLGRIAWQRKQPDAALKAFESELAARGSAAHRDEHEIGVTLHNIADLQAEHDQPERAIANYRRALTHKEPEGAAITLLALREALIRTNQTAKALEVGQQAVELVQHQSAVTLQLIGYTMAVQAQAQYDFGRVPRGAQTLGEWRAYLLDHLQEGLMHTYWGVKILSTGLYLRSNPPLTDPIAIIDLAEQSLGLAEQQLPNSGVAWSARRNLGNIYLQLERWSDASEVLEPFQQAPGSDFPFVMLDAYLGMARAALQLGQLREAVRHFEAAADYEPDPPARGLILCEAAEAFHAAGDEVHTAEYYLKALELLQRGPDVATYIDTLVTLAYTRLGLRRFGEAIDTFEEAITIVERQPLADPGMMASVLFDMASAHHTLGQYRRAAETYQRSLSYQDMNHAPERYVETQIALARSSAATEAFQTALRAYHEALQFDILNKLLTPDQRRAVMIEQANAFAQIAQIPTAISTYQDALAIDGASALELATVHRSLGTIYKNLGDHEKARQHFEQVLAVVQDDQTGSTLQLLADGYRAQGQIKESIQAYQQAIEFLDRKQTPVELAAVERSLGELYLESHQASEALKHLEIALEIERALPQQNGGRIVSILQHLATVHEWRGERERAAYRHHEALVYQDVRHAPEQYVETLRTLGRLYTQLESYGEAIKAYNEAIATESRQPTPDKDKIAAMTYALAEVYRVWGHLEQARDLFGQAASNHDQAKQALRAIETEIGRHLQTLDAAAQSWNVLNRGAKPELSGLAFIRTLQTQTYAALGRGDQSQEYLDLLMTFLADRRRELQPDQPSPALQALALLLAGHDSESAGNTDAAMRAYRNALAIVERDPKGNTSLVWVIRRKIGRSASK